MEIKTKKTSLYEWAIDTLEHPRDPPVGPLTLRMLRLLPREVVGFDWRSSHFLFVG